MNPRSSFISVLALLQFACNPMPNPPASATSGPALTTAPLNPAELDSIIRKVVTDKKLIGLTVGVMQNGNVVLAKGYGTRTLKPGDSVTASTLFAIGSVTKEFTCTTALLLAQDGKLSMQDKVAKYFPRLTRAADITLLDLGQHVTGYRDYYPLDFVDREMQKPTPADSIIVEYAARPLDFEPGSRWSYSNTNFLILGRAIEIAGGKPVQQQFAERIFGPLGMDHTKYELPRNDPNAASGYTTFALGAAFPALPEADGWVGAAGAIWSTPTDLMKWDLGLMDGKVLAKESYRLLTTPRTLTDSRSTGYGCGLSANINGETIILSHGGAVSGFVATNIFVPATRSAVVVMSNADGAATGAITDAIVPRLVPRVTVPKIEGSPALAAATTLLQQIIDGKVDRTTLGDDYNAHLTPALAEAARASLRKEGAVTGLRLLRTVERGGMEVAVVAFKAGATDARALMYRSPDGKIQEFLITRQ